MFFADDGHREPDELIEGAESSTIRRRLNDGTAFRIVKTPLAAAELGAAAAAAGLGHRGDADGRPVLSGAPGGRRSGPGRSGPSSARACRCSSSASTPRCARPRSGTTSPGRGTASGRRCTRPGSRRGGWRRRRTASCPRYGVGVTNLASRPTREAAEITPEELRAGAASLEAAVRRLRPRLVAVLGLMAYRTAFARPRATMGLQPEPIGGRPAWVLPNPSGLNAHYKPADFARLYAEARAYAETLG